MTKPGQVLSEKAKKQARIRNQRWRANNAEKAKAYHAEYYRINKKRLKAYARKRYQRLKDDKTFKATLAATQRRYYRRQRSKKEGQEEAIAREMRSFQQQIIAQRGPGWYDNQGGEKRSHKKKVSNG